DGIRDFHVTGVQTCALPDLTRAFGNDPLLKTALDVGGDYQYRQRGEDHAWTPDAVATLQHAVRRKSWSTFKEFSSIVDGESAKRSEERRVGKEGRCRGARTE